MLGTSGRARVWCKHIILWIISVRSSYQQRACLNYGAADAGCATDDYLCFCQNREYGLHVSCCAWQSCPETDGQGTPSYTIAHYFQSGLISASAVIDAIQSLCNLVGIVNVLITDRQTCLAPTAKTSLLPSTMVGPAIFNIRSSSSSTFKTSASLISTSIALTSAVASSTAAASKGRNDALATDSTMIDTSAAEQSPADASPIFNASRGPQDKRGLSSSAKTGIGIGAGLAASLIILACWIFWQRSRQRRISRAPCTVQYDHGNLPEESKSKMVGGSDDGSEQVSQPAYESPSDVGSQARSSDANAIVDSSPNSVSTAATTPTPTTSGGRYSDLPEVVESRSLYPPYPPGDRDPVLARLDEQEEQLRDREERLKDLQQIEIERRMLERRRAERLSQLGFQSRSSL